MKFEKDKLLEVLKALELVLERTSAYESMYRAQLDKVHPYYLQSARNLVHYLAVRSLHMKDVQEKLDDMGLPFTLDTHDHVLFGISNLKMLVNSLMNREIPDREPECLSRKQVKEISNKNREAVFGKMHRNRRTAIMVTQPLEAARDQRFTESLMDCGMDSARVNCAHYDEATWKQMVVNIRSNERPCTITMDLGGPKLRTGAMKPGPKVIQIKPRLNAMGRVIGPARIWLAPYGTMPPQGKKADVIIPVNRKWLRKTKKGSYIVFEDTRSKSCRIDIDEKVDRGRWGSCRDSAFVTTETLFNVYVEKKSTSEVHRVQELLPLEEVIYLFQGDLLRLDKDPIPGEPAIYDENGQLIQIAHISCTLPEVFQGVNAGDEVFFNDGKIEGIIKDKHPDHFIIEITSASKKGGKLRADKGINFPNSDLGISGLTQKDRKDLRFVVRHADSVNFSFVNSEEDVEELLDELKKLSANLGIILKIETKEGFRNLPEILLKSMENYPIAVMIARGDLAVEAGWKNFVIMQEEILNLCKAAHLPAIWATQVLENLTKKGTPTRAEMTDAAMAQRADCIMLNKGPYIEKTVRMLDKVVSKMQRGERKGLNLVNKPEMSGGV